MTNRQIEILRHALGWPKCYRNHYVTEPGANGYGECEQMVDDGLMERHKLGMPKYFYVVTDKGRAELEGMK